MEEADAGTEMETGFDVHNNKYYVILCNYN